METRKAIAIRLQELLTSQIPHTTQRMCTHRGLSHSVVSEEEYEFDGVTYSTDL
jgi:hypothetical protein